MKIVLAFDFSIGEKDAINDARLQRFRLQAIDGRDHAFNVLAVDEGIDGIGAGISDKMPDGLGEFVGLQLGERIRL